MKYGTIREKAQDELNILFELNPDNNVEQFRDEILNLCDKLQASNMKIADHYNIYKDLLYTIDNLCIKQSPITPVYDENWSEGCMTSSGKIQFNERCYGLVKSENGVYYMNAIEFKDNFGCLYTTHYSINNEKERINSSWYIKEFPFVPKTFVIDVIREHPNKHAYLKDKSQLDEVYEYYKEVVL